MAPVTNRIRLPVGPEDGGYFQIEAQHIDVRAVDGRRTLVDSLPAEAVSVVEDVLVSFEDCLFAFFS